MKLFERLPNSVVVNGRKCRINLDFRNVLKMLKYLSDESLLPEAREWLALKCICRHPRKGMLEAVTRLLFPYAYEDSGIKERLTDFEQDADLIRSAFLQAYGINLFRDKLNWFEFCCFLSCMPEGNRYSDILSIRSRPIPEPTKYNQKDRELLMIAKSKYRIKLSEKEQKQKYQNDVGRIFAGLEKMIPPDGGANNGE